MSYLVRLNIRLSNGFKFGGGNSVQEAASDQRVYKMSMLGHTSPEWADRRLFVPKQ